MFQLQLVDGSREPFGQLGLQVILWDPADLIKPLPEAEEVEPPQPLNSPSNRSSNDGRRPYSPELDAAARRSAADSKAARAAAEAASAAALVRPTPDTNNSARQASDAADDSERVAEAIASMVRDSGSSPQDAEKSASTAASARKKAEDAARQTMKHAIKDAVASAKEAARRAAQAANAAAEIAEKYPYPEIQVETSRAVAAAQKAAGHAEKCEGFAKKVESEPDLNKALANLRNADEEVKATQRQQLIAEDAARRAGKLMRKRERDEKKRERDTDHLRYQRESELDALKEAERRREAERENQRRRAELRRHNDNIQPIIYFEGGIPPAACCYIPSGRAQMQRFSSSPTGISTPSTMTSLSPSEIMRYRYDVTSYGVPDPELDILIEGEMQGPQACCMCCGIRWKKCTHC